MAADIVTAAPDMVTAEEWAAVVGTGKAVRISSGRITGTIQRPEARRRALEISPRRGAQRKAD